MAKKRTTEKRATKKADPVLSVRYDFPPPVHPKRDWTAVCGDASAGFCADDNELYICSDDVIGCMTICFPSSDNAKHLRDLAAVCAAAADVLEGKKTPEEHEGGAA